MFFLAGKFQNMRFVYGRALEIAKELMDHGALPIRNRSVLDDNLLPTKVSWNPPTKVPALVMFVPRGGVQKPMGDTLKIV